MGLGAGIQGNSAALAQGMQAIGQGVNQGTQMGLERYDQKTRENRQYDEAHRLEAKLDTERERDRSVTSQRAAAGQRARLIDTGDNLDEGPPRPDGMITSEQRAARVRAGLPTYDALSDTDLSAIVDSTVADQEDARASATAKRAAEDRKVQNERYSDELKWGRDVAMKYVEDALKRERDAAKRLNNPAGMKIYTDWSRSDAGTVRDVILSNKTEMLTPARTAEFNKAVTRALNDPSLQPNERANVLGMLIEGGRGTAAMTSAVDKAALARAEEALRSLGGAPPSAGGPAASAATAPTDTPPSGGLGGEELATRITQAVDTLGGMGLEVTSDDIERITAMESLANSGQISQDDAVAEMRMLVNEMRDRTAARAGAAARARGAPERAVKGGPPAVSPQQMSAPTPTSTPAPGSSLLGLPPTSLDREAAGIDAGARARTDAVMPADISGALTTGTVSQRVAPIFKQAGFTVSSTVREHVPRGGVPNSRHMRRNGGDAIDLSVADKSLAHEERYPLLVEDYQRIMSTPELRRHVKYIQLEMPREFEGSLMVPDGVKVVYANVDAPHIHIRTQL